MTEWLVPSFILAVEIALVVLITLLILIGFMARKRRGISDVTQRFVSRLRREPNKQAEEIRELGKDIYRYNGDELKAGLLEVVRRERALYNRVLNSVIGNDTEGLMRLNEDVRELLKCYSDLVSVGVQHDQAAQRTALLHARKQLAKFQNNLATLEAEKKILMEKLDKAQSEMDSIIAEYSHIYGRGKDSNDSD